MRFIKVKRYEGRRERIPYISHYDSMNGSRLTRCLRRCELVAPRDGAFAAVVGLRRRHALSLGTTCRGLARQPTREAVEGPDQDQDRQKCHRNVNATTQPNLRIADCIQHERPSIKAPLVLRGFVRTPTAAHRNSINKAYDAPTTADI